MIRMNFYRGLTALLAAASFAQTAHGAGERVVQVTEVVQTFRDVAKQPASVVEDLGDIRPLGDKPFFQRLRFTAFLAGEFVSNAQSVGNHGSGDFLLLPSLNAAFEERFDHGLSLSLDARAESFNYAKFDEYSFWGFSGSVFLNWQPTKDNLRFYAGIEPYWYASVSDGDQLSEALAVCTGLHKEWAFNRDQSIVFLGYDFASYFSYPAADSRNSHRATVGLTQQIRPSLYGQIYYSYQYSDYTSADRRDSRNLVGLNLVYRFNEHWSATAATYFVDNDSTVSDASYQTFGIGLGASYQF